jgi:hypothetical protein
VRLGRVLQLLLPLQALGQLALEHSHPLRERSNLMHLVLAHLPQLVVQPVQLLRVRGVVLL